MFITGRYVAKIVDIFASLRNRWEWKDQKRMYKFDKKTIFTNSVNIFFEINSIEKAQCNSKVMWNLIKTFRFDIIYGVEIKAL